MNQETFACTLKLNPTGLRWRAEHPTERDPVEGTVQTRSRMAAIITAAVELLHATRYGLAPHTWRIRLWDGEAWSPATRTARIMGPTRRLPRRVYVPGIGLYDEQGEPIRTRRQG